MGYNYVLRVHKDRRGCATKRRNSFKILGGIFKYGTNVTNGNKVFLSIIRYILGFLETL